MAGSASDFGTFGRYCEVACADMTADTRDAYAYTAQLRGLVPGPHKIWLANPQLLRTIAPTGAYYQKLSTLSKAEIEIATSVICGHWRAAYACYEHEIIGREQGGLQADAVAALIAGLPTSFSDARQQAVYELAHTLAARRVVPLGLYRKVKGLLGDSGIVDVTVLMGWFTSVSLTLNAFDVPSSAQGLQQGDDQQQQHDGSSSTAADEDSLGGRLPLFEPSKLSASQQSLYADIRSTMVPWAEKSGFMGATSDGRLVGPFNPALLSPGISAPFLALQEAEQKHTTLDQRTRQVVILAVGAVWKAPYELYAHSACARAAGLSNECIARLVAGGTSDELTEKERTACLFTHQLSARYGVDTSTYERAVQLFGQQGVMDITYLAGTYFIVCGILNAFHVPAPVGQWPTLPTTTDSGGPGALRKARLSTVALFPAGSFLEQLAVRSDNSALVTVLNKKQLWYVPPASGRLPVEPQLLCTFDTLASGIAEVEPDVFLVATGNLYTAPHACALHRLDLNKWQPAQPVQAELVYRFPDNARGVNGFCLLASGVALVADSFAGLIWRVDFEPGARTMQARVWLAHSDSMGYYPGKQKPEQPGVNGLRYASRAKHVYYTATAKKLLMRVAVDTDSGSWEAVGQPELVLAGRMGDDFCIDNDAGVLYLCTHRQNTIDRVSLEPSDNSGFTDSVAGEPFTEELIGPTAGAWSRTPGHYGKVAFFLTDGGTASPAPCGPRPAKLMRVDL